ncbi:MAG: hypothetical protein EA379_06350 [Phycisphaerales bacterium]|nr:MAG: hypothetical protein EA379_06350 [Phycisphaerales bacterium]
MAIGVVAVLLGITLPAFAYARRQAAITDCHSTLRSITQGLHASAGARRGEVRNLFLHDQSVVLYEPPGTTAYPMVYFDQSPRWAHVVEGVVWNYNDERDMESVSCRAAIIAAQRRHHRTLFWSVVGAGTTSYFLSAAFFSAPDLWNPDDPAVRQEPERRRAVVLLSQVTFPSSKVVFAETKDHHGSERAIDDDRVRDVNAAFTDGHVRRVSVPDAAPALEFHPYWGTLAERRSFRMPFSSAAWGYQGRDF